MTANGFGLVAGEDRGQTIKGISKETEKGKPDFSVNSRKPPDETDQCDDRVIRGHGHVG
jgi:hypothetical protein